MKPNMPQIVAFKKRGKVFADISRIKKIAHRIDKHIAVILRVVAVAADSLVFVSEISVVALKLMPF